MDELTLRTSDNDDAPEEPILQQDELRIKKRGNTVWTHHQA